MMASATYSRTIPQALITVTAIALLVQYFFVIPAFSNAVNVFTTWMTLLEQFVVGAAFISFILYQLHTIQRREKGQWQFSVLSLFWTVVFVVIGLGIGNTSGPYMWLYNNIYSWILLCTDALMGFFIVSATYKAFKARSMDTTVLLITGCLCILRITPLTEAISPQLQSFSTWIYDSPNMFSQRAIYIGAAIGGVIMGLRTILGIERKFLR